MLPAAPRPNILRRSWKLFNKWGNLFPFVGLHLLALGVFFVPFSWECVALAFTLFVVRTWGLTAGFHRYFAHRGYKTSRWFQFVIAWTGTMAIQKGPLWWAGEHRKHHRYSDTEQDPHSPIAHSTFWAHVGWVMDRNRKDTDPVEMKDWAKYPELKLIDDYHPIPGVLMLIGCYALLGWPGVLWGVFSTVCLYHTTFCVNSVCHLFGYRRFGTDDHSRNNWLVAILTMGEGWHNNHHHYPSAARQGFYWYEVDASYIVLRAMALVGLVWDLREPTERALAHRRLDTMNTSATESAAAKEEVVAAS
ncbi:MAG: acyl-CoA desaturase [Gemmataceae bacterium]